MAQNSIWYRPYQRLLLHGTPLGRTTFIVATLPNERSWPIGAVTSINAGRLIFWPIVPEDVPARMQSPDGTKLDIDHVTLESSGRSHITSFDSTHYPVSNPLKKCLSQPLSHWFTFLIHRELFLKQSFNISVSAPAPKTDVLRRKVEAAKALNNTAMHVVKTSETPAGENWMLACAFYIKTSALQIEPNQELVAPFVGLKGVADFDKDEQSILFAGTEISLEDRELFVVAGFLEGELQAPYVIGFPRADTA